ncbi:immunity protein 52 of polymorphic toxin system [Cupriavidus alkaliphilus]|uniref:Imm52 family immunity protein n=1 Tax=Cupriavidus alkaliphilus TaxID=942866 RepID=UPI000DE63E16|nr:Imm52 family immunity protein [Cupriavidus alkaliphilus]PVY81806.1 immunity protein 52 of polymorphic toxin system [Cupriavidus alkaliphilus]
MTSIPALELSFRRNGRLLPDVQKQLAELHEFARVIGSHSPLLRHWYLSSSKSKEDALLYPAFEEDGPTTAALAVLEECYRGVTDVRSIALWNGAEKTAQQASLTSLVNVLGPPDRVALSLRIEPSFADWKVPLLWLEAAVAIWRPLVASFGPFWYSEHKVFRDRPGVSWLFYLPRVLSEQQVPEAGLLHPVLDKERKQIGTVIVSIIDEPFSEHNPEHVRVANAIEMRLADQDLLPRYAEL